VTACEDLRLRRGSSLVKTPPRFVKAPEITNVSRGT
jgi:hypothetical protein